MENKKRNTKPIPIIIVLTAAAISCIISIIQQVEFGKFFIRLLVTVIVFAIIGITVRIILNIIFKPDKEEFNFDEEETVDEDAEPSEDAGDIEDELEEEEEE